MLLSVSLVILTASVLSTGQYRTTVVPPPPPPVPEHLPGTQSPDSVVLPSPVKPTLPTTYEDYIGKEYAADLSDPKNVKTVVEYDPEIGMYVFRTIIGDKEIVTPYLMTSGQYNSVLTRREMLDYFRQRNSEIIQNKDKNAFNLFDVNFALGPLEKVFGPGGVRLSTQGSVQLSMGIKSNKTDNPALSMRSRRRTFFNFDQKIQTTVSAAVGDKLKFNMGYNTDATFDFDSRNLKLNYEGKEDEIIKSIEAGNVSMTTGSSLIKGGTSLFGIKTKLQFGKLTLTGLVSQQNSESKSVSTSGGVQTTSFSIKADNYDANRHFFLAQFFYDNYDRFAATLPHVTSGINITRIEVWVTNKSGRYEEARNIVGFMDLGENIRLANSFWRPNTSESVPSNRSNDMLDILKSEYPGARNINEVTQVLSPLQSFGIIGGKDFEKVESARLLNSSEYTLNPSLGYISLK